MSKYTNIIIIILITVPSLISSASAGNCPAGDLSGDCKVNLSDLIILSNYWLEVPDCQGPGCPDITGQSVVNFQDFAVVAANWQKQGYPLVINEYMSDNENTIEDPDDPGSMPDWIEIYNYGSEPVDLAGMFLSDSQSQPLKWTIPSGNPEKTTVPAGGYLVIWADEDLSQGPTHADFKLSNDGGEYIGLYAYENNKVVQIDGVSTAPQRNDESIGRMPDGSDVWQSFLLTSVDASRKPTPKAANGGIVIDSMIVINEIMYHPISENDLDEYIEIYNRSSQPVNLDGWAFTQGVDFVFPDITIIPNGFVVIAGDVSQFNAICPNVPAPVVGGWTGRLSNRSEKVTLVNDEGMVVDTVEYSDQGDWAKRLLGPVDYTQRGWIWSDAHDGGGKSLELTKPDLPNEYGQNWAASTSDNGTPGKVNSTLSTLSLPVIINAAHEPLVPDSSETVTVSAEIVNPGSSQVTALLAWRVDQSVYDQDTYPAYISSSYYFVPMTANGKGVFSAEIPPQADGTVIEFFISASNDGGTRTFPAPCDIDGADEQVANLLYQVDDSFDPTWTPGDQPLYRVVMTQAERDRIIDIGDYDYPQNEHRSNAQMNATFISFDGGGMEVRYNIGIRNRGNGSRRNPPMNFHINYVHGNPWNGLNSMNLNSKYTHLQVIGSALFRLAGVASSPAKAVQLRINGQNLAATDTARTYGSYVALESYSGDYLEKHFPDDSSGNIYRCTYDVTFGYYTFADFQYHGPDPNAYRYNYHKKSNVEQDDWSDIYGLTFALSDNTLSDDDFMTEVKKVVNIRQWARFFAADTLIGNREGGLCYGTGDDYAMYRGVKDQRFILISHDLDTILGQGQASYSHSATGSIYGYGNVAGLNRLFNHPEFMFLYYQQLNELASTVFTPEKINPVVDQLLAGWVPDSMINGANGIKTFFVDRANSVLYGSSPQVPDQSLTITGNSYTTDGLFSLSGNFDPATGRSITVDGQPVLDADWNQKNGTWSFSSRSLEDITTNEMIIARGSFWKYLDDGSNQGVIGDGANWYGHPQFDDSGFKAESQAQFGYGDGDEATTVSYGPDYTNKYVTTYFRKTFDIADASLYTSLKVRVNRDDSAAVYLNGTRIALHKLSEGFDYLTYADSPAVADDEENTFFEETVDPSLLVTGTNVIAAEVHQISGTSSDISFDLELEGVISSTGGTGESGSLKRGMNRVKVKVFDGPNGTGNEVDSSFIDIYNDPGFTTDVSGILTGDPSQTDPDRSRLDMGYLPYQYGGESLNNTTTWTFADSPYLVTDDLTIPEGLELVIEPGVTVLFDSGTKMTVNGKLTAVGAEDNEIFFRNVPNSSSTWDGLQFVGSMSDNRISRAVIDQCRSVDGMIGLVDSKLLLDNSWLGFTGTVSSAPLRRIEFLNSSLIVDNCIFSDMCLPGQAPTDNVSEHIWGRGVPEGGSFIIKNNIFGVTPGHNDAIDIDSVLPQTPVPHILNNVFLGGGDDALDLETDAYIEGNVFKNYIKDVYNTDPQESNVVSVGRGQTFVFVRNVFMDCQHAVQVKDNAFLTFINNTIYNASADAIYFGAAPAEPGRGVYIDSCIFANTPKVLPEVIAPSTAEIHRSIVPLALHSLGDDNIGLNAEFVDASAGDFSLVSGSPGIGKGLFGFDIGAVVDGGVVIMDGPEDLTYESAAVFNLGSSSMTGYSLRLDGGSWSGEFSINVPITLSGLSSGEHVLEVIGKNHVNQWQDESEGSVWTWTVDSSHPRILINEVSAASYGHDWIELYNDSSSSVSLTGMSISDDIDNPDKYVFGAGVTIPAGGYLVLHADNDLSAGPIVIGFELNADGEGVYLFDASQYLVDSIEFGYQIPSSTIGRAGRDRIWTLNTPTPGLLNIARRCGNVRNVNINEWLAASQNQYSDDFIELYNPDKLPVDISGLYITDNIINQPTKCRFNDLSFIDGFGLMVFRADGSAAPGHVDFKLDSDQEWIALLDAELRDISKVLYMPQTTDISQGAVPDGSLQYSFFVEPTPGILNNETIVINEVLAHSHEIEPDWIELYNSSDDEIDISGWYLTDDPADVYKFEIPAGTILQPGDYAIFYEDIHFGELVLPSGFGLSEGGERLYLYAAKDGELTGYSTSEDFGASDTNVSLGRYLNSTGAYNFIAMSEKTEGYANSGPLVGPVVISEIMYNPSGDDQLDQLEYIELVNITSTNVNLFSAVSTQFGPDPAQVQQDIVGWSITSGIEYAFPDSFVMSPGERVLLVKNLDAFNAHYTSVPVGIRKFQWTSGSLSNSGESLQLSMPGDQEWGSDRYWICIDRVKYSDTPPWPQGADGDGASLKRIDESAYGNDPANWQASE